MLSARARRCSAASRRVVSAAAAGAGPASAGRRRRQQRDRGAPQSGGRRVHVVAAPCTYRNPAAGFSFALLWNLAAAVCFCALTFLCVISPNPSCVLSAFSQQSSVSPRHAPTRRQRRHPLSSLLYLSSTTSKANPIYPNACISACSTAPGMRTARTDCTPHAAPAQQLAASPPACNEQGVMRPLPFPQPPWHPLCNLDDNQGQAYGVRQPQGPSNMAAATPDPMMMGVRARPAPPF